MVSFLQRSPAGKFSLANRGGNHVRLLRSHRKMTERPAHDITEDRRGNDAAIDVNFRLIDEDQSNQFGSICRDKPDERP